MTVDLVKGEWEKCFHKNRLIIFRGDVNLQIWLGLKPQQCIAYCLVNKPKGTLGGVNFSALVYVLLKQVQGVNIYFYKTPVTLTMDL